MSPGCYQRAEDVVRLQARDGLWVWWVPRAVCSVGRGYNDVRMTICYSRWEMPTSSFDLFHCRQDCLEFRKILTYRTIKIIFIFQASIIFSIGGFVLNQQLSQGSPPRPIYYSKDLPTILGLAWHLLIYQTVRSQNQRWPIINQPILSKSRNIPSKPRLSLPYRKLHQGSEYFLQTLQFNFQASIWLPAMHRHIPSKSTCQQYPFIFSVSLLGAAKKHCCYGVHSGVIIFGTPISKEFVRVTNRGVQRNLAHHPLIGTVHAKHKPHMQEQEPGVIHAKWYHSSCRIASSDPVTFFPVVGKREFFFLIEIRTKP